MFPSFIIVFVFIVPPLRTTTFTNPKRRIHQTASTVIQRLQFYVKESFSSSTSEKSPGAFSVSENRSQVLKVHGAQAYKSALRNSQNVQFNVPPVWCTFSKVFSRSSNPKITHFSDRTMKSLIILLITFAAFLAVAEAQWGFYGHPHFYGPPHYHPPHPPYWHPPHYHYDPYHGPHWHG
uniref:Uncharacterized protein n=1 Tax=Steinernema glaseri TaxID=37863 RepID=A0A1I8A9U3_9BILA